MKKCNLIYRMLFVSLGLVSFLGNAQNKKSATESRPNIIVFLVDDMGWQDTSLPFWTKTTELNKRYHTPNMERLAKEGMKFTSAYANPVCTPTRVSLLTGMNEAHTGVTRWVKSRKHDFAADEKMLEAERKNGSPVNLFDERNDPEDHDDEMIKADWNYNGLSPVPNIPHTVYATTYPQLLKDAGYFTVHIGKGHWAPAGNPGTNAYNLGFIVNVAGHSAGFNQSYLGTDDYGNLPGKTTEFAVPDLEEYYDSNTFLTEALTLEAMKALENPIRNKQPFYLNMAQYAVHVPIMADNRFIQKYLDAGLDPIEAGYATIVEGMDRSLGDLMDFLKKKGIEKNTIIIFMSDNGGFSISPPRGGESQTQNLPLKAGKSSVCEGGIREPMIVKWPGVVKPSTVANQYVMIEDFFPTIMEMAQVKNYKTVQSVDGKSFLPILKNPNYSDPTRALIWHYPNKWLPNLPNKGLDLGINYFSAVRKGDWKLIYSMRTGKKQLYNINDDIGENNDLSDKHPDKVKELSSVLSNELRRYKAPMPSFKSTGKTVPMPDEVK